MSDGTKALRFQTVVEVAGKRTLSAPLYQIRCRCRNPGCGATFTGLSGTPQAAEDPARLRVCDRCFSMAERPSMVETRHSPWERLCPCGEKTHLPTCPRCKEAMPEQPSRGFPRPRYCARCQAIEYLSVAGRIMLDCNHGWKET